MRSQRPVLAILALVLTLPLSAAAPFNRTEGSPQGTGPVRFHAVATPPRPLTDGDRAILASRGVDVLNPLGSGRYAVSIRRGAPQEALRDILGDVQPFDPNAKLTRSARREAARGALFSRVAVVFHQDVTFEEAESVIRAAGGSLSDPLDTGLGVLSSLRAFVPPGALQSLAADDRVLLVAGHPGIVVPDNTEAASLSNVQPVQQAPYGLSGSGVPVSVLDCGSADAGHREFQGRLTAHDATASAQHPTHVSGTIAAAGIRADAKGMAPSVRIEQFDLKCGDSSDFETIKKVNLPKYSIKVDNNSWSYVIGWYYDRTNSRWDWEGATDLFGSYTALESAVLDRISIDTGTAIVFSSGNDGDDSGPSSAPFPHTHDLGSKIYCYSANGSGKDCPAAPTCDAAADACEIARHPADGMVSHPKFRTVGMTSSAKNIIAVGGVDGSRNIGSFSGRGPTQDGRVKPEVVAHGVNILSTLPGGSYGTLTGTSMSTPVVSGVLALLVEQWRRTFAADPSVDALRALVVNGAKDLGNPGPDYTFGFGLLDAKASVDLIVNDGGRGEIIRKGSVAQGQTAAFPVTLGTGSDLRVTLAWIDPEVVLTDETSKSLVNDLDMIVRDPAGAVVRPFVLDPAIPEQNATTGVNQRDNIEEIEIRNSLPGVYTVEVTGTQIATGGSVAFTLVANPHFTGTACSDRYEPNDTEASAFGNLLSAVTIQPKSCSQADVDYFRFAPDRSGTVRVEVTATDVPLRLTVTPQGKPALTTTINAGSAGSVQTTVGSGTGNAIAPVNFLVKVEPLAAASGSAYQLTATFGSSAPKRRHSVQR